jgi:hypothetical protein
VVVWPSSKSASVKKPQTSFLKKPHRSLNCCGRGFFISSVIC